MRAWILIVASSSSDALISRYRDTQDSMVECSFRSESRGVFACSAMSVWMEACACLWLRFRLAPKDLRLRWPRESIHWAVQYRPLECSW